ncbi:phosphate/phosphite/phosphonate ABC transporter substrate-binding protein [Piscinibacter terrae]|nr:phosphate/phosphite/phosphonate ABC transporter substrate-binding protein [Albitalea terrae]
MPKFSRRSVLACCLALAPALCAAQGGATRSGLVFGIITPRAAEQMKDNWRPFVERLGQSVSMAVELRAFAESNELVAAFRKGEVDLAWMGNAPALDVVESGAGAVYAQGITRQGSVGYNSVLVVPIESPLRSLDDVLAQSKKLRFGDGDLKSTSGHLVPYYFAFQKHGVNDLAAIFKSVSHASHQKNLTMAAKAEVDVATANNEEIEFFAHDAPALARRLRVIWESPVIPQSPLLWRLALPLDLRRKILAFTTTFGRDAEQRRILAELNNLSGFRQSSNRQLVSVADIEMFKARQAINNDLALAADERAQRIDEVIRRGSRLDLLLKVSSASAR